MARKIIISNQKGGVGKSTTAIMLGQELKRLKKKVLTIDLDSQMNTTRFYGVDVEDAYTVTDILYTRVDAKECIHKTEYGDIIPADPRLSLAEEKVSPLEDRFIILREGCASLEDLYDYIVIDTPPAINVTVRNGFAYADDVIIPVSADGWSVGGVMELQKAINLSKRVTNPGISIMGILMTNYNPMTNTAKSIYEISKQLAEGMGTRVFDTKIRRSVKIQEALTVHCIPLYEYSPKCTCQIDYENFAKEFIKLQKKMQKGDK